MSLTLNFNAQEVEREATTAPDLQIIQARIKDIIHVLQVILFCR